MRKFFAGAMLLVITLSVCGQSVLNDSVENNLTKAIDELAARHHIPGLAVAIIHKDEIVFSKAKGYMDLDNKTAATIETRFPIMSVTKTFTATMLMQLVEKGVVQLNDNVRKYIPEYRVKSGVQGKVVTNLFQLATHTAGLPRNSPADLDFNLTYDRWMLTDGKEPVKWGSTNAELLRSLQFISLEYPPFHYLHPNDRHYSNLGYSLLGIALERAAKTPYPKYVATHILHPLKMLSSGFLDDPGMQNKIAKGYSYNAATGTYQASPFFDPRSAVYAGGMYSTVGDLAKFISAQYATLSSNSILSPMSLAMMRSTKIGWKPAFPYVLHEGSVPGYRSIVVFNPDLKVGWVILTNADGVDFNQINGAFAKVLQELYSDRSTTDLAAYAGVYELPGGYGSLKIYLKDNNLHSTYLEDLLADKPMVRENGHRFKVEGRNGYAIHYEFVPSENKTITAVKLGQFVWYKKK